MASTTKKGSSTKDLKRVLGRKELMSAAVGQIIGAGVMVMSISALAMTGRSVNIAFVLASLLTIIGAIPTIYFGSVVRLRGGTYTQAAVFINEKFAGFYIVTYIFSNMSLAMYAIGFTSYLTSLVPGVAPYAKYASAIVMTVFFILNFFGAEWMAKIQNIMFYVLVIALLMFTAFGLPQVHWSGYFGNELFGRPLIENGLSGLLQAASFLTFATGGATIIVQFSAEAINPQKDIPFVVIVSTLGVSILYALLATCIGGILPPDQVIEAGNLSVIAKAIMPTPLYYFFIVGGAMFALGTTLNASIGWVTKPILQACEDGWFPPVLGTLHPKFKSPYILQAMFYVVNLIAIFIGLDVSELGKMVLVIGNVVGIVLALGVIRLPKLFPEAWAKSPFHVSDGVLKVSLVLSAAVLVMQFFMNMKGLALNIILFNVGMFIFSVLFAILRYKSGKVNMTVSYEVN
ncbi:MAG: APC family permease [Oscillospiraceae bacterium]